MINEETLLRVARAQGAHEEQKKASEELRLLRAWAKADIRHWKTAAPPETWSQREAARSAVREFYGSDPENVP